MLDARIGRGFLLVGPPGSGKTTWMQRSAAIYARRLLSSENEAKLIILLSLRQCAISQSLEESIAREVQTVTRCSRSQANRLLQSGLVILLLDGLDENPALERIVPDELHKLSARFPKIPVTVSSRPIHLPANIALERVEMPTLTPVEITAVLRRYNLPTENR